MITGELPDYDERRRIVERAKQRLGEACALVERLNQLEIGIGISPQEKRISDLNATRASGAAPCLSFL